VGDDDHAPDAQQGGAAEAFVVEAPPDPIEAGAQEQRRDGAERQPPQLGAELLDAFLRSFERADASVLHDR